MKGQSYKTKEGETIKVEDFDEVNKMAYVHIGSGQYKWYTEAEYSLWQPAYSYIPDIPAQMIEQPEMTEEEKPKKKRTKKEAE